MTAHTSKELFKEPPRTHLLNQLWAIQNTQGYIDDHDIYKLAKELNLSYIEVEGVATFYHFFHRQPTAKNIIYLNNSIVSDFKGYERIKESLERECDTAMGYADRTSTFALFNTPCIGLSDQEPAALINFYPFTNLKSVKVKEIISKLKSGVPAGSICDQPANNIRYPADPEQGIFFRAYRRGCALSKIQKLGPTGIIDEIKATGLSGRGGAFFPTWIKWDACRKQPAHPKFIVCNADEGEPGTFKDRVLMNAVPETLLEGMIVAGYTVGADHGIIYLRGEYKWLLAKLENHLEKYRELGFLGKNIAGIKGFNFDIRIQLGAGAYVCGEETALLESLEGKRGEPRTKWFFPIEKGYLNQPTVINNVETFCAVARIIEMGSAAINQKGIPGSYGTKLISVSGDCKLPGIYEIEWGMTVAELLELCQTENPYFIQVSGPSGELISIKEKFRRISMLDLMATKDIRCGGSFMIFNESRDLVKILINFAEFFKHESCGICTPCRAGNFIIQRKLLRLQNGLANAKDLDELKAWSNIMKTASRCGLGKTAGNSQILAVEKFRDYFESRLNKNYDGLHASFNVAQAVADYEQFKN